MNLIDELRERATAKTTLGHGKVDNVTATLLLRAADRMVALEAALRPFAKAWDDEMFLWSNDDLERFRRDGIPTSNPRYGDGTSIYCVIEPGEDHEDRSDDGLFTVGDLRGAAFAMRDSPKQDVQSGGNNDDR